jgi:ubiquinone/menaquinone biosynthesis C-methylase UbiE
MKNEIELINYYNKFNEDKRLNTKHGNIEYQTGLFYLLKYLKKIKDPKIIDIGAGTGKYSITLDKMGYDVTAVELVKHNLKTMISKDKHLKAYLGNALDLKIFNDNSFDVVILFGPMYHLISLEDKIKALNEAKRIVKQGGYIFISYCMNEYAVITHGFIENKIKEELNDNKLTKDFHILAEPHDLYSFMRIKDINYLNKVTKLKRIKIVAQDGPTEYFKKVINQMNSEELQTYFKYHLSTCEDKYLLGASRHVLDILKKIN